MARSGVTYEDITDAIQQLQRDGISPTLANIRLYLGTGSHTTISKLMRQYKDAHSIPVSKREGLSQEVIGIAKTIQDQINKLAIKEINAYRFENMQLKKELKEAKETIKLLKRKKHGTNK